MQKSIIGVIGFLLIFCIVNSNAHSGPIMCDGELTRKTAKATGQLLCAFGFAYTAIGFQEVGEPKIVKSFRKIINPVYRAETAGEYFKSFIEDKLPSHLEPLDSLAKEINYEEVYKEKILRKGFSVPDPIWKEVSSQGKRLGLKGLIGV